MHAKQVTKTAAVLAKRLTNSVKVRLLNLLVEYVTEAIYGFNLGVKVEQTAAINIVKDKTAFTVEGWKIAKEIKS